MIHRPTPRPFAAVGSESAMQEPDPGDDGPSRYGGVIGIGFVVVLVITAIYLLDRMQAYATLGDCMITHAPQCRALIGK